MKGTRNSVNSAKDQVQISLDPNKINSLKHFISRANTDRSLRVIWSCTLGRVLNAEYCIP
jgi:hypothetical protein